MIPGSNRGSLGPTVWLFVLCLFYLLPVIILDEYIGAWDWLAGVGFWAVVYCGFKLAIKVRSNND
jgi:hypothetical protein